MFSELCKLNLVDREFVCRISAVWYACKDVFFCMDTGAIVVAIYSVRVCDSAVNNGAVYRHV